MKDGRMIDVPPLGKARLQIPFRSALDPYGSKAQDYQRNF
jgi:hypothetical protein